MDAVEKHAEREGYEVLELGALNKRVRDKVYKRRSYVEKDFPSSSRPEQQRGTSALPNCDRKFVTFFLMQQHFGKSSSLESRF